MSEIDKDTFTTSRFKKMVQECIDHGLHALDQKFDHMLQNLLPGQSCDNIVKTREQAKERIIQSAHEAYRKAGWTLPVQEGGNVKWESSEGPILVKRGLSLQKLKLNKANIAQGNFGSVSIFENENGDKLIGKILRDHVDDNELNIELEAYQIIYDSVEVGPHPNLVNAYGIAQVPHGTDMKRVLLMDFIPGPTGEKTFDALRKCWDAGKISSEKYWGAIQFIGRRLLDLTQHLGKAGVVHNDIKPANFLVNEKTGEPVLIDFGVWSKTGEKPEGASPEFWSPEAKESLLPELNASQGVDKSSEAPAVVDERSDVFTVATSLLDGVEHLQKHFAELKKAGVVSPHIKMEDIDSDEKIRWPYKGLLQQPAFRDAEGNMVREPGTYTEETAYTRFMNSIVKTTKADRVNSEGARKLAFLNDSMLDDDAAKKVITNAISLAGKEEEKTKEEQLKQATPQIRMPEDLDKHMDGLVKPFRETPTLAGYATLWKGSKANPKLRDYLDSNALDHLQDGLEEEAADCAKRFIADAPWFDAVKKVTTIAIPTGVEEDGTPRNPEHEKTVAYKNAVIQSQKDLEPHANIENLRKYAEEAEAFLRDAMALKKINTPEIAAQLDQVKECAAIARRMVEILDTESTKPGIIKERVREFERQLKRRK